ncbi:histone H1 [Hevea brasiliensis]|nr:histone H1 [Hevea brasiliensis]
MVDDKEPEVAAAAVEEAPATEEETKPTEKPVKEKKPRVPKEKKPKQPKTASHPPYFQMIKEALLALNEKSGGSSPYAIAKYMEEKHKAVLPANFKKILALQLKNATSRGKLIKIKASYKLSEAGKKEKSTGKMPKAKGKAEKKAKETNTKATTTPTRKTRSVNKSEAAKKPAAKRVGTKKAKKSTPAKPKQPKSIKSPTAKRMKKTAGATAS